MDVKQPPFQGRLERPLAFLKEHRNACETLPPAPGEAPGRGLKRLPASVTLSRLGNGAGSEKRRGLSNGTRLQGGAGTRMQVYLTREATGRQNKGPETTLCHQHCPEQRQWPVGRRDCGPGDSLGMCKCPLASSQQPCKVMAPHFPPRGSL